MSNTLIFGRVYLTWCESYCSAVFLKIEKWKYSIYFAVYKMQTGLPNSQWPSGWNHRSSSLGRVSLVKVSTPCHIWDLRYRVKDAHLIPPVLSAHWVSVSLESIEYQYLWKESINILVFLHAVSHIVRRGRRSMSLH